MTLAARISVLSAAGLLVSGCGNSGPPLGSVTGVVTLDGKPVAGAFVTFSPEETGRPSQAKTDETGRYELQFSPTRDGALIGSHQVRVSTQDIDDNDRAVPETIPKKYNRAGSIPVTINDGPNEINLELFSESR